MSVSSGRSCIEASQSWSHNGLWQCLKDLGLFTNQQVSVVPRVQFLGKSHVLTRVCPQPASVLMLSQKQAASHFHVPAILQGGGTDLRSGYF